MSVFLSRFLHILNTSDKNDNETLKISTGTIDNKLLFLTKNFLTPNNTLGYRRTFLTAIKKSRRNSE